MVYVCNFLLGRVCVPQAGGQDQYPAIPPPGSQAFAVMQQVMPMVKLLGCN